MNLLTVYIVAPFTSATFKSHVITDCQMCHFALKKKHTHTQKDVPLEKFCEKSYRCIFNCSSLTRSLFSLQFKLIFAD